MYFGCCVLEVAPVRIGHEHSIGEENKITMSRRATQSTAGRLAGAEMANVNWVGDV